MRKPSPPIPDICGSTTFSAAATAIAASTAFPPAASVRTPASAASGCPAATIPFRPATTGRYDPAVAPCGACMLLFSDRLLHPPPRVKLPRRRLAHVERVMAVPLAVAGVDRRFVGGDGAERQRQWAAASRRRLAQRDQDLLVPPRLLRPILHWPAIDDRVVEAEELIRPRHVIGARGEPVIPIRILPDNGRIRGDLHP